MVGRGSGRAVVGYEEDGSAGASPYRSVAGRESRMRSFGGLAAQIASWDNLRLATARALRGCRDRGQARAFVAHLEEELSALQLHLASDVLDVGRFHRFTVYDPKRREICAPHFRERVLHHAIMNVCSPILDRRLITDCYACRLGKGHRGAIERASQFARKHAWFLKLDVRRYFDSIDHGILLAQLERLFRERTVRGWFAQILATYAAAPGKGLPIGSLISQHLANSYLAPLDRLVKQGLRIAGYVRYMDDAVLWSDSKDRLFDSLPRIEDLLGRELLLELKGVPFLNRTILRMDFLGMRVFPGHCRLSAGSRRRFRRRVGACLEADRAGEVTELETQQRLRALVAITSLARAWQFRRRVMLTCDFGDRSEARTVFSAAGAGTPTPGGAALPTGTGGRRTTATGTPASASSQLRVTEVSPTA